jgi:hypothetical protein
MSPPPLRRPFPCPTGQRTDVLPGCPRRILLWVAIPEVLLVCNVRKGKLMAFSALRQRAIEPAVDELNALGDYHVQIDGVRTGRAITKVRMIWFPKDEQGLKAAYTEVQRHKAGRKARIAGGVERITGPAPEGDDLSSI